MAIKNLYIQGYRSIQELQLPLGDVNIITGENGCGKSNLYKAVYLIAQAARGRLSATLAQEGGLPSAMWAGERKRLTRTKGPKRIILGVDTDEFNYAFQCGLPTPSISKFGLDPMVKEEYVWFDGQRRKANTLLERKGSVTWVTDLNGTRIAYPQSLDSTESVLSQLHEPHLYPELSKLRMEMQQWRFYHHFHTDVSSQIRLPQTGIRTFALGNDGIDLAAALQTIIEIGDHETLAYCIDRAFPGSSLVIQSDDKSRFEVLLNSPGIKRPLEARELSDGTLRYLCLVAALLSPRPPTMLALNEPETSLHPDLIPALAELITNAAKYSQLWITTHSSKLSSLVEQQVDSCLFELSKTERGTQLR